MTFVSTDPASHNSQNTWFTPKIFIDSLGPFDLDPATSKNRPFNTANEHYCKDNGQDGLTLNWNGFVWLNPPYGKEISPFIKKFKRHNNGIALVFSRTGTPWLQDWISCGGKIFFLRKRVKFIDINHKQGSNAGADSCLLIAGDLAINRVLNSGLLGVLN